MSSLVNSTNLYRRNNPKSTDLFRKIEEESILPNTSCNIKIRQFSYKKFPPNYNPVSLIYTDTKSFFKNLVN